MWGCGDVAVGEWCFRMRRRNRYPQMATCVRKYCKLARQVGGVGGEMGGDRICEESALSRKD